MTEEVWKSIKGLGNKYQVSDQGHIRIIMPEGMGDPRQQDRPPKGNKRRRVDLYHPGKEAYKSHYVDEIVAEYFLDEPGEGYRLIHINHDKSDDRACNLQWVSPDTDLRSVPTPHKNYRGVRQISQDGSVTGTYRSVAEASKVTGISYQGITRCCTQVQATSGGFRWEYTTPGSKKIKPRACPICGSPVEVKGISSELRFLLEDNDLDTVFIECNSCGLKTRQFQSEDELVKYWNTRVK